LHALAVKVLAALIVPKSCAQTTVRAMESAATENAFALVFTLVLIAAFKFAVSIVFMVLALVAPVLVNLAGLGPNAIPKCAPPNAMNTAPVKLTTLVCVMKAGRERIAQPRSARLA